MSGTAGGWTFLSNHGHVLVCLAQEGDLRVRDLAERVGITERAAQSIISDLADEGYVVRTRVGRRNTYRVVGSKKLRHPVEEQHRVADLIEALTS